MQQLHTVHVILVSVGYRKELVHMLALFALLFASQNSGEAIGGGGSWGGTEQISANKDDLFLVIVAV